MDFAVDTTTKLADLAAEITNKVEGVEAVYDSTLNTFGDPDLDVGADQTLTVQASSANLINTEDWTTAVSATGTNISGGCGRMGADTNGL